MAVHQSLGVCVGGDRGLRQNGRAPEPRWVCRRVRTSGHAQGPTKGESMQEWGGCSSVRHSGRSKGESAQECVQEPR